MSQEKVNKRKSKKQTRKQIQRKKSIRNLLWILAGCIIFGGAIGFLLGKFWLYPAYEEQKEDAVEYSSEQPISWDVDGVYFNDMVA